MTNVSDLEDREIYEAVENLNVFERGQRRLFTLADLLPHALVSRLHNWMGAGGARMGPTRHGLP